MLSQSFLVSLVVPFAVSPALTGVILILLRARSISTCTSTPAFLAAFKARVTSASLNVHGPLPKTFCAGGDVKSMAEGSVQRSVEEGVAHLRGRMEVSRLLHEIPKPTIAKVNGPAAGAGMALALACDLRVAAQSARFVTAFANIGFSGDFGGSYFLSKLVGTGKARELYYTAEPLDAAHALALGVVNQVVPDAELVDATMQIARKLAKGPRIALALMKQNFNVAESGTLAQLLDLEARRQIETGRTDDHKEAARAFVEKRAPLFTGR